ncbi:hypothetical protein DPMN_122288 [Dreissena polymorpha]|uniref:Uncharacterized protein n=1 Tax=Dreissena polymorpha TaxID=45954 RepID=A0A9D4GS63_DREPO|nr:hypothetical protein DPMN_122288 [Dreissena polymorpha]
MRTSLQTDIENCTKSVKNITCLKEDMLRGKDKSDALSFVKFTKCLDQSFKVEAALQEMKTKNERTLIFNPDTTIQQTLSTLSGLGQTLSTVQQSQPAIGCVPTQKTITRQNKPKSSSQSDPRKQTTQEFKVKMSTPEFSPSRQYIPGNQTSDMNNSYQMSDQKSNLSQQPVQGHQPGEESKHDPIIKGKSSQKYCVKILGD